MDAAQSGATIEIEEGEYAEQLVLGKPVTLKGLGTGPVIRSSGVLMLLRVSSCYYMCPRTTIYVSSYCVLILLYTYDAERRRADVVGVHLAARACHQCQNVPDRGIQFEERPKQRAVC